MNVTEATSSYGTYEWLEKIPLFEYRWVPILGIVHGVPQLVSGLLGTVYNVYALGRDILIDGGSTIGTAIGIGYKSPITENVPATHQVEQIDILEEKCDRLAQDASENFHNVANGVHNIAEGIFFAIPFVSLICRTFQRCFKGSPATVAPTPPVETSITPLNEPAETSLTEDEEGWIITPHNLFAEDAFTSDTTSKKEDFGDDVDKMRTASMFSSDHNNSARTSIDPDLDSLGNVRTPSLLSNITLSSKG